jgi:hypothetical protein
MKYECDIEDGFCLEYRSGDYEDTREYRIYGGPSLEDLEAAVEAYVRDRFSYLFIHYAEVKTPWVFDEELLLRYHMEAKELFRVQTIKTPLDDHVPIMEELMPEDSCHEFMARVVKRLEVRERTQ